MVIAALKPGRKLSEHRIVDYSFGSFNEHSALNSVRDISFEVDLDLRESCRPVCLWDFMLDSS